MNPAAQAIALLLMLGDDFTERECRKAFEDGGITTSLSYLQMMGYVNQIGVRKEEVKSVLVRTPWQTLSNTYRISDAGKGLLK
jgi:hypothetical protein